MSEVSCSGDHAGDVVLSAEFEGVVVSFAAAWVDDHGDAGVDEELWSVWEGEEGVGDGDGAGGAGSGFLYGELAGGESVHLAGAGAVEHGAGGVVVWCGGGVVGVLVLVGG